MPQFTIICVLFIFRSMHLARVNRMTSPVNKQFVQCRPFVRLLVFHIANWIKSIRSEINSLDIIRLVVYMGRCWWFFCIRKNLLLWHLQLWFEIGVWWRDLVEHAGSTHSCLYVHHNSTIDFVYLLCVFVVFVSSSLLYFNYDAVYFHYSKYSIPCWRWIRMHSFN